MLTKFSTPFKIIGEFFEEYGKNYCNKSSYTSSSSSSALMAIGLQTIFQTTSEIKSNIVVKCSVKKPPSTAMDSCFLKSCFLCNKILSLDKDVYMYRGDRGFCSIECRSRQIYLDEIKDIEEASSKKKFTRSYCSSSGRHETRRLLEDLRRRNNPVTVTPYQNNHWAIVS